MRRIAHVSDLHFGRVDNAVVEALVDELNGDRPDLVIVSGDLTQGARRAEFIAARHFLDRLASPWIAVPGNHDISPYHLVQRFLDPFARFRRHISAVTEPVWQDEEIAVVGVNSARAMLLELNWAHGSLSRSQIERAEARFTAMPASLFRIVVAHHPFLPPNGEPTVRTVGRSAEALDRFQRADVKLALSGHLHRGYARFLEPVLADGHIAAVKARESERAATRSLLAVQAASATSTRLRGEPNAYNRIRVEDGLAAIEPRIWTGRGFENAEAAASAALQNP
jgi:3',5'-cyclic AMP phosphodiesterase CpdA